MAGEPLYLPILLGMGLKELSTTAQSIPVIKNAIRTLDDKACHAFLQEVLKESAIEKIEAMVKDTYGDLLNNNLSQWE
jgi:phosphotransferase system enzyme I (PtsI)